MLQEFFSFLRGFLNPESFIYVIYNSLFISGFDRIMSFEILFDINIDFTVEMYFDFMYDFLYKNFRDKDMIIPTQKRH